MAAAVLAEHLRQHEARRPGAEHENRRAHPRGDAVEAVGGAGGGLKERRGDGVEVMDCEDALHWEVRGRSQSSVLRREGSMAGTLPA